jgi:hypothetical protein
MPNNEQYIDRAKIDFRLPYFTEDSGDALISLRTIKGLLAMMPTEEDVVKVVRCKDCAARENTDLEPFMCTRNKMLVYRNSFCSFGQKE